MAKIINSGIRPSPVYEAHMSDGETVRMSFWSPKGKPIDMDAGRRTVESILLTDQSAVGTWERSRGYWRCLLPARDGVAISRAFVEHPSLGGRIEHLPRALEAKSVKRKAKASPLSDRARAFALMLVDEFAQDRVDAATVAQAVIGLRDALRE